MSNKPQVVKLAQPGIDVKTAGDENLIYNSNWPLLKIYKQGSYLVSDVGKYQVVTTHDLGYTPFFIYFSNSTITTWGGITSGPVAPDNRAEYQGPLGGGSLNITDSRLELTAGDVGSIKIYYYIFALDLNTNYLAPQIKSGGVISPHDKQTVFKLAKEGKDVSSNNLEDYIIHSRARSPLIHQVSSGYPTPDPTSPFGYSFVVYHNLGYNPMFFVFSDNSITTDPTQEDPKGYIPQFLSTGATVSTFVDENKIRITTAENTRKISVVILKDPFDIVNPISVIV